jgi:hypothetical protein
VDYYVKAELDSVQLVYNEFKSVIQQRLIVEPLLPIRRLEPEGEAVFLNYIYEQPAAVVFDRLLPRHVETQIFRAMLESEAAEHGARMTAMDSATRNAEEMIGSLTLRMNRMRQASITKELIEIVSGAEALERMTEDQEQEDNGRSARKSAAGRRTCHRRQFESGMCRRFTTPSKSSPMDLIRPCRSISRSRLRSTWVRVSSSASPCSLPTEW